MVPFAVFSFLIVRSLPYLSLYSSYFLLIRKTNDKNDIFTNKLPKKLCRSFVVVNLRFPTAILTINFITEILP